jgi:hypothetical protein
VNRLRQRHQLAEEIEVAGVFAKMGELRANGVERLENSNKWRKRKKRAFSWMREGLY